MSPKTPHESRESASHPPRRHVNARALRVPRVFTRVGKKPALPPGTLEYYGERRVERVRITVMDYDEGHFEEKELSSFEECFPYRDTPRTSWINIDGLHDTKGLEALGNHFGLHPLVLEDVINVRQRAKQEDYETYIYLVFRMIDFDEKASQISTEQISVILGPNYVLSFQEAAGDVWDPIRERIRGGKGRSRKGGPDYLAYALLDAVVDHYYVVLEKIGDKIEALEDELVEHPTSELMRQSHNLKRDMIILRRAIWPLREVVAGLQRGESKLIKKGTGVFLRDVYDHTVQAADVVESYRDVLSGLQDLYLSSLSHRMNEVMKVLTIIATIFVPLTFLVGVYGMNFQYMPELGWRWGYFAVWGVMLAAAGSMLVYFRKKRWL